MKDFEKAKKEYLKIKAPDELSKTVETAIKNKKRNFFILRRSFISAACIVFAFVFALNISPDLSKVMADIPLFENVVRVVTLGRFEHTDDGYSAKINTPKIEGLLDSELMNKLNSEFKENADYVIAAYEADVKKLKKEFGDESVQLKITSDYIVKTDNDKILAIDVYIVNEVGSSSTKHTFYNIDKTTGELLTLDKLFKKDVDYVEVISGYIKKEMQRQNNEENAMYWIAGDENSFDGFDKIKKDQNFYINENGDIVICFDKYEVAPGAAGSPEFVIPSEIVKGTA